MSEPSDRDLIVATLDGRTDAFADLVRRHEVVAHRVAALILRSAGDAEDVTQEAFVKAYLHLRRFQLDAPFRPWLLRIVGNEARNRRRSGGRRTHYEARVVHDPPPSGDPEHEAVAAALQAELLAAVNGLPEKERVVIALRFFADLSEAETAATLGIPAGTVKSRLSRAMNRLRKVVVHG